MMYVFIVLLVVGVAAVLKSLTTIDQAHMGVTTIFGKYRRALPPGLHVLVPFVETVHMRIPVQNNTAQLRFSAITQDQAAVHFTATLIYTPSDHDEYTMQLVAFKFTSPEAFYAAMVAAVEAAVREYVATRLQAEVLGVRGQIVDHAKSALGEQLAGWGFTLMDLTVNDIAFDQAVMQSMSRVVAAKNAKSAAEYEGEALLIARTKEAEANGAAIRIAAENEAEAARLRGEGLAKFRREVANGLADAQRAVASSGGDEALLAFALWTETMTQVATVGKGNVIFFDGSQGGMEHTMRSLQGMLSRDLTFEDGLPGDPNGELSV